MRVLFRCDAGIIRGSGHLVRCLTLADALAKKNGAKQGCEITFACRKDAGAFLDLFKTRDFNLLTMPEPVSTLVTTEQIWTTQEQEDDFKLCQDMLDGQVFDWVIVDHYALSAPWETLARSLGQKILVIDDLANRSHDCDALLDQNEYVDKADRYSALVPVGCHMLLGGKYVLLRDEFGLARQRLGQVRKNVDNAVILMGGSDYHGQSLRIARILQPLAIAANFGVDIILGQQNQQRAEIEKLAADTPLFRVHTNHGNISSLMLTADIAFGAGGTSTWEFCCLGVPTILLSFAKNQIALAQSADRLGIALYAGDSDKVTDEQIIDILTCLAEQPDLRQSLRQAAVSLIDGKGAERLATLLTA